MEIKGFILSAGFGTRLKPITDKIPKPLVKLGNKTLVEYGIELLQNSGIKEIGINIHHKKEIMENFAKKRGLKHFYEKEILGTGGYLKNLKGYFNCLMVTVNCDTVFFGDDNIIQRLVNAHIENHNLITLVLKKIENEKATPFEINENLIKSLGKKGEYFFTGLQILSPDVLNHIEFSIVDTYKKLIIQKKLGFVEFKGKWFDCGTLNGLINANKSLFGSKGNVLYPNAEISKNINLKNSIVYPSKIKGRGQIVNSIVYENADINLQGEKIENKIIV